MYVIGDYKRERAWMGSIQTSHLQREAWRGYSLHKLQMECVYVYVCMRDKLFSLTYCFSVLYNNYFELND